MSRVIDFNELKNRATDKEIDKFEQYIYSMYYSVATGDLTMAEFSKKVMEYMKENNISEEKFLNIQKEFMKRYGFDMENIEEQMKNLGINFEQGSLKDEYEFKRRLISFKEKYNNKIKNVSNIMTYSIKNDKNNLSIHLDNKNVLLQSEGSIDLQDNELAEFLCSYKKLLKEEPLEVSICEFCKKYTY